MKTRSGEAVLEETENGMHLKIFLKNALHILTRLLSYPQTHTKVFGSM